MNDRDNRRLLRGENVLIFLTNNAADFAAVPAVAEHAAKIRASVDLVTGARAGQVPNRVTKATRLDSLLASSKRIAATARSIEGRDGETGFAVPYNNVPRRIEKDIRAHVDGLLQILEDKATDTPEQTAAKAALRGRFTALGMRADFVTKLRENRDGLDEIHEHNRTEVQEGTEDTALIDRELTAINEQVDILEGIIGNVYEAQPEKLHAWKRARRVESAPRRSPQEPAPGGQTPDAA